MAVLSSDMILNSIAFSLMHNSRQDLKLCRSRSEETREEIGQYFTEVGAKTEASQGSSPTGRHLVLARPAVFFLSVFPVLLEALFISCLTLFCVNTPNFIFHCPVVEPFCCFSFFTYSKIWIDIFVPIFTSDYFLEKFLKRERVGNRP